MYQLESEVNAQTLASGHRIIVGSLVKNLAFPLKEPQVRFQTLDRRQNRAASWERKHRRWAHSDPGFLPVASFRAVSASQCPSTAWSAWDEAEAEETWEVDPLPTAGQQTPGWGSGDSGTRHSGIAWHSRVAGAGADTSQHPGHLVENPEISQPRVRTTLQKRTTHSD